MVGGEDYAAVFGVEVLLTIDGVGDVEMVEDTATEFSIALAGTPPEHFVHLVLANHPSQTANQKLRDVSVVARQAVAHHSFEVDLNWLLHNGRTKLALRGEVRKVAAQIIA